MSLDVHTLTGAYALDAVEDVERRRFEDHLLGCPDCAQEVRELRATAARLGLAVTEQPPTRLHHRVLTEISGIRQERPGRTAHRIRRPVQVGAVAAAIALAGAAALGVLVARADHQLAGTRAQLAQVQAAGGPLGQVLAAPDAHTISATTDHDGGATLVVSNELGAGILTVSGMPRQPEGRIYEAWVIGLNGPRPAGLLGSSGASAPRLVRGLHDGTTIAVTVEPAGGSAMPTSIPVLQLDLAS
ncbi:MAG TPA: anti-sigma factor [Pseudonocardiaceae bacterium]|nr:anti-sigma factor [Pseudonocardiaceae bacterium]